MNIITKLKQTPTFPKPKMCKVPLCKNKNKEEGLVATSASIDFKEDETVCDLDFLYQASRLNFF